MLHVTCTFARAGSSTANLTFVVATYTETRGHAEYIDSHLKINVYVFLECHLFFMNSGAGRDNDVL